MMRIVHWVAYFSGLVAMISGTFAGDRQTVTAGVAFMILAEVWEIDARLKRIERNAARAASAFSARKAQP
jgi:hypothetical protein